MDTTILLLFQSGNKLKQTTLYHLLVGKGSSSVLLFGFFQRNLKFFGLYPQLTKPDFTRAVMRLEEAKLLKKDEEFLVLTTQGKNYLDQINLQVSLRHLNNYRYGRWGVDMWRLVLLAVQVVSELSYQNKSYVPVETNQLLVNQLKKWLQRTSKAQLIEIFSQELARVLESMPQKDADFLARQFSGHEKIGAVEYQLASFSELDAELQRLMAVNVIHGLLAVIEELQPELLFRLLQPFFALNTNQSMEKTKQLFLDGNSPDQIAFLRRLKRGTINDHLIEWALETEDFPFTQLISAETISFFQQFEDYQSLTYQQLHEQLPIDYLEFRLAQIYLFKTEGFADA